MNKLYKLLGLVCVAALFAGCNEDPEYFELKTYPDEMHIRSSVEEITLNKGIASEGRIQSQAGG